MPISNQCRTAFGPVICDKPAHINTALADFSRRLQNASPTKIGDILPNCRQTVMRTSEIVFKFNCNDVV